MENKWIKVEDKLPNDYQRVMYFDSRDKAINIGYFVPSQSRIESYITHWMLLPEPPTE